MLGQRSLRLGLLVTVTIAVLAVAWAGVQGGIPDSRGDGGRPTPAGRAVGLVAAVEDVPAATAVRYGVRDSAGHTMDTAKIIAAPAGGYLAVYHFSRGERFAVALARSTDLLHWTYVRVLARRASQPYIWPLPSGEFVVGWESHLRGYRRLSFRYYASSAHLMTGRADRSFDAPHTLVPARRYAEGTPNIYSVTLAPDIDHSAIEVGFHYFRDGEVDRQARGLLRDFSEWKTRREPAVDAAIEASGVGGNIGDRDHVVYRCGDYNLVEGQRRRDDFGSWRVFLWDWRLGTARELAIRTHRGSSAFANPALTTLRGPDGAPVIVVSLFVPSDGAASGEAGQLIYYRKTSGQAPGACPASVASDVR